MKQNSFISVILTVACSLMFVACSDWTEPTPVDYNPIFPDEQDPSLHEKYEQSLKEYKNRKHTLMLIRFANNPGTTLGEQDFLRSLPDSVDFVVLTNADNLSVYDKEDISKLKRTGTKFLYYKNLSEFYDQCEETENLEEFKTKMDAALKNGESDETTAIREKLAAIGGPKANNGKLVFFDGIVTFTVDYSGRYEEPFIDLVDYFVDGQIVLLESSLEIKLNMSQPVGFYGKMPKEKVITTATPPTDDGKTGIISREDLDVIQTSEGMAYIINHFITGLGNNGPLAGVSIYNANEDYLATDGVTNYRRIRDAIQKLNPSPIN